MAEDFLCYFFVRFYIILQGSVNIYRLDDETPKFFETDGNLEMDLMKLHDDPEKREEFIGQTFGNYIVTLGKAYFQFKVINYLADKVAIS